MALALRRLLSPAKYRQLLATHPAVFSHPATENLHFARQFAAQNASTTTTEKLELSDSCLKRLREICLDGSFLRITVEGGGCSGFQYKFDLDTKLNGDDLVFGEEKAKVVIDTVSLEYCTGSTVDYHSELIRSGFRIMANPKAEQGCSCGSSFALKLD